jgi:FtsP/CotA-like multicopper oxidase with cupredoxin domain
MTASTKFPRETAGLPAATATDVVELAHGDRYTLRIAPVTKRIGDATVRMLAYNGSIPGPTMRVPEGAEVIVEVENEGDLEATVHWHGLRLDNRYDGTHETQDVMPVGGRYTARVTFPDPGVYWYHPHIREDYGQELGLYGNCIVVPAEPNYWPAAHRELALTLDDVLIEDGQIAAFSPDETTYAAMGRFGNVLLIAGEPELALTALAGEVVRFYFTNTANTRVFKVALPGARMRLVGGDSGRVEHEQFVEDVILAPSERVVIDVLFAQPGRLTLDHRTPERTYSLATINVSEEPATPSLEDQFTVLRHNPEWVAERGRLDPFISARPDKVLAFVAEMDMGAPAEMAGAVFYTCPMHPGIVSHEPGRCPKCGMHLQPTVAPEATGTYTCPMHPEVVSTEPGSCPKCGMKLLPTNVVAAAGQDMHSQHADHGHGGHGGGDLSQHGNAGRTSHQAHEQHAHGAQGSAQQGHGHRMNEQPQHDLHAGHGPMQPHGQHGGHDLQAEQGHGAPTAKGIEWEDDMVAVNRMTTPATMRWKLIDKETGAEGHAIDWSFRVGDRVKMRLVNETESDHPMQHPFHIHGAGRFVVLSRDGNTEPNLMWKDTVLVRTGQTVDILLEVTNPGVWMAHCHIAEHHESGMMLSFRVTE